MNTVLIAADPQRGHCSAGQRCYVYLNLARLSGYELIMCKTLKICHFRAERHEMFDKCMILLYTNVDERQGAPLTLAFVI